MKSNEITIVKQIAFFSVVAVVLGFLYGEDLNSLSFELPLIAKSGVFTFDNLSKDNAGKGGILPRF